MLRPRSEPIASRTLRAPFSRLRSSGGPALALLCVLTVLQGSGLLAQDRIPARTLRTADKAVLAYGKAEDAKDLEERDAARRKALVTVARLEGMGRAALARLVRDDPSRSEILEFLSELDRLEGRRLERAKDPTKTPLWSPWVVPLGEVLLVRGGARYAAITLGPDYDPGSSKLTLNVAKVSRKNVSFGARAAETETMELDGQLVTVQSSRPSAYPPRDYAFRIFGADLVLRSRGSNCFQWSHQVGSLPVARAGKARLARLRSGEADTPWSDRPPEGLGADLRRIRRYAFRLIEEIEPSPSWDTENEARYDHTEMVRAELRLDEEGRELLIIAFPHSPNLSFDDDDAFLLRRFARAIRPLEEERILIQQGGEEARIANRFWDGKRFRSAKGPTKKLLLKVFADDY